MTICDALASPVAPLTVPFSRVIVVVLDGLRPDAIERCGLHHLRALCANGPSTMLGTTVSPSVTAAAMTSLFTGVHPEAHGVRSDRFHIPSGAERLLPVPKVLADAGIPTFTYIRELPLLMRPLGNAIARRLGVTRASFKGKSAPMVLVEAREAFRTMSRGLFVLHWGDADQAGHQYGWMSAEYADAAKKMDASLGLLATLTGVASDPSTLLIALADHGGGGVELTNHESDHPLDRTIPIVLSSGALRRGALPSTAHLVDVPATILYALGVAIPESYAGRPFVEALAPAVSAYAIAS